VRPPPEVYGVEFLEWLRERTERAWADTPAAVQVGLAGARWERALSEAELARAEARFGAPFPDDYRLFLATLGSASGFYDWTAGDRAIELQLEALVDGIVFDVEVNGLWRPSWGPQPADFVERRELVTRAVARAPRLLPLRGHRYLLAEPCRAGNPVFSIYQTDAIVYGADLRQFLLNELGRWAPPDRAVDIGAIPFWGALIG
jgi:hypothetical protein